MRGRALAVAAAVAAAAAAGGAAAVLTAGPDAQPPVIDVADRALVAEGRTVYAAHCASCHGASLEGQPDWRTRGPDGLMPAPPHDVAGHTWHHPPEQLFGMVKHGLGPYAPPGYASAMPAYASVLSDREIRAVLSYIASSWPEEVHRHRAEAFR
jgi:mono/diheme cytochrome c family protein